ncbi:MAG: hypothetical protein ACRCST_12715 [Turicibacter sp.]
MTIEATTLTKEQLISNIWRTDELIHEIDIVKGEVQKKKDTIQNYVATEQHKYLREAREAYTKSEEVLAYEKHAALVQKTKDFKGIVILIDLIICVLLGDLFFVLGWNFILVLSFWIISPFILFYIYKAVINHTLMKNQPKAPLTESELTQQIMSQSEYIEIANSIVVTYANQEFTQLQLKIENLEQQIREESVLKEIYWSRTRKLVWYLENQMADNLKEALATLANEDHREELKQMVATQNLDIAALETKTDQLMVENQRLSQLLAEQQDEINDLQSKRK